MRRERTRCGVASCATLYRTSRLVEETEEFGENGSWKRSNEENKGKRRIHATDCTEYTDTPAAGAVSRRRATRGGRWREPTDTSRPPISPRLVSAGSRHLLRPAEG